MRQFSVRPSLTMSGRASHGPRGLAGKPFHPPLTDIPVAAYVFVAVFDVLSAALAGGHAAVGEQLYRAATWVLIGGAAVSLLTAATGALDWQHRTRPGTQVRRTANTHAAVMITVTVIVLVDLLLRLTTYSGDLRSPALVVVLSVLAGLLVMLGAGFGGSLVYDYGVSVETSAGSVADQPDEHDVMPGELHAAAAAPVAVAHAPVPEPAPVPGVESAPDAASAPAPDAASAPAPGAGPPAPPRNETVDTA